MRKTVNPFPSRGLALKIIEQARVFMSRKEFIVLILQDVSFLNRLFFLKFIDLRFCRILELLHQKQQKEFPLNIKNHPILTLFPDHEPIRTQ